MAAGREVSPTVAVPWRSPSPRPPAVGWSSLGNGAGWDDPLGRLTGDVGNEIEVAVVVQHDKPGGFGRRSDEQVCDLCSALGGSDQRGGPERSRPDRVPVGPWTRAAKRFGSAAGLCGQRGWLTSTQLRGRLSCSALSVRPRAAVTASTIWPYPGVSPQSTTRARAFSRSKGIQYTLSRSSSASLKCSVRRCWRPSGPRGKRCKAGNILDQSAPGTSDEPSGCEGPVMETVGRSPNGATGSCGGVVAVAIIEERHARHGGRF